MATRPKSGEHDANKPSTPAPSTATAAVTPSVVSPVVGPKTVKPTAAGTTTMSKKAAAVAAEKAAAEAKAAADALALAADEKTSSGTDGNTVDHNAEVARLSRRSRAVAADCQRTVERILADQHTLAVASFGSSTGRPRDDAEKELAAKMERTKREMERRQRELVAAMAAMVKATAAATSLQGTGDDTKRATEYVKVAVRTRPTPQFADDAIKIDAEKNAVGVHLSKAKGHHVNNQVEDWSFGFDSLLHNSSQEAVYDACARDIVDNVVQGYNGTVLCYGQTGAGKTYTMNGGAADYKSRGIIPRAISHIFRSAQSSSDVEVLVRVSYLEIYNEMFYDLLARPTDAPLDSSDLAVREDEDGQVIVKGLTRRSCDSEEAALNMLFEGETNRSIASHDMNSASTRSHCIFTIWLESRSRIGASEKVMHSKLNLVDLAGSERVGKTGSTGSTLAEAKYINKSLTFLEQVVVALGQSARDHIPFRQSKLTNVLRDSLGGNCKTRLIANIWCERLQLEETISTLKFATRMMRIALEPTINVKEDPTLVIAKQAREIKELKAELAMHDTLTNRVGVAYDVLTNEQLADVKQTALRYVRGELADLEVVNLRQTKEMFRQLKQIAVDLQHKLDTLPAIPVASAPVVEEKKEEEPAPVVAPSTRGGRAPAKTRTSAAKAATANVARTVDLSSTANGAAAATTPTNASATAAVLPSSSNAAATTPPHASTGAQNVVSFTSSGIITGPIPVMETKEASPVAAVEPPREAEAFEDYKRTDGQTLAAAFDTNREQLKVKKRDLVSMSGRVNDTKRLIDELNQRIAGKRAARPPVELTGGVEVVDEEEFELMKHVRNAKKTYQDQFQNRMAINSEVTYLKNLCDQAKLGLANQFLIWYQKKYGVAPMDAAEEAVAAKERQLKQTLDDDPDASAYYNARKAVDTALKQKKKPAKILPVRGSARK